MGAVTAQAVTAGGSLVLQLLVARALGPSGFGTFSLLLAALVLFTAVQAGWIGDSLTVLDGADQRIRGALMASQAVFLALGSGAAYLVARLAGTGGAAAAAFATLTGLWLLEDTCRRMFMIRLRFWQLVANDVLYLAATVATLTVLALAGLRPGLVTVLLAMAAGAAAAVAAARWQLPEQDFRGGSLSWAGLRELGAFAFWRSAQIGIQPLGRLLTSSAIAAFAGVAALGQVQVARLLLAPLAAVLAGVGSFLLPVYSRQQPGQGLVAPGSLRRQAAALIGVSAVYCVLVLVLAPRLAVVLLGDRVPVERATVAAWAAVSLVYAAVLPVLTASVVLKESRRLFLIRLLDLGVGVSLVVLLVLLTTPGLAPLGLVAGNLVTLVLLWARRRGDARPADADASGQPEESDRRS